MIKVGLCCAALELVAKGEADLAEILPLPAPGERVAGGGILKQLEVETISLRDAVELTITLSDNVATNALVERCGVDRVNAYLAGLGLAETRILGQSTSPGPRTTSRAASASRRHGSKPRCSLPLPAARCSSRASASTCSPCSASALPGSDPALARLEPVRAVSRGSVLTVANKTGELDGIRADVGLVRHRERGTVAVAVFTDGCEDLRETVDVEGSLAVAECSAAIAARLLGLDT